MKKHLSLFYLCQDVHAPTFRHRATTGISSDEETRVFLSNGAVFHHRSGNEMLTCVSRGFYFSENSY